MAIIVSFGVWRSLVAHLHGVQGVEGSNPFTPTNSPFKAVCCSPTNGLCCFQSFHLNPSMSSTAIAAIWPLRTAPSKVAG